MNSYWSNVIDGCVELKTGIHCGSCSRCRDEDRQRFEELDGPGLRRDCVQVYEIEEADSSRR